MRTGKLNNSRELALTPLYPPYFFKLLIDGDSLLWQKINPFLWYFMTSLELYCLGIGFVIIMRGFFLLIAAIMGVPWAGHPAVIIVDMVRFYIFSLFTAWLIKRDSL